MAGWRYGRRPPRPPVPRPRAKAGDREDHARLIAEHAALRDAIGGTPSVHALYRFAGKLRKHEKMLTACIDAVLATLRDAKPEMGKVIAIDGSDLPAYGNGQKYVRRGGPLRERFADPDAS